MRTCILLLSMFVSISLSAQDSYYMDKAKDYMRDAAQEIEAVDSICADTIDSTIPPIPQIPLEECDSLMVRDVTDHYGVVYKDGKCGIYDLIKYENVTRIEYSYLCCTYRKELNGEYYTNFFWEEPDTVGVIGVAEVNNHFIGISMPKKKDEGDRYSRE